MHRNLISLLCIAVTMETVGCSSISGHKVIHDSAGNFMHLKEVDGLPIVVQNPKRALFVATTSTYRVVEVRTTVDAADNVQVKRKDGGQIVEQSLSEAPVFLGPSEIYTIDPKRPFAGTLDYSMDLDKDRQYPTKIAGKLDDKTLDQFRQLAKDLAKVALKAAGAPGAATPGPVVKEAGEAFTVERTLIDKRIRIVLVDLATGRVDFHNL